jgi:hypothetical protein
METVDFPGSEAIAETNKAIQVKVQVKKGEFKVVWIAKSQIHDDSEIFDARENSKGKLVIPAWLAEEKGL